MFYAKIQYKIQNASTQHKNLSIWATEAQKCEPYLNFLNVNCCQTSDF